MHVFTRPVARYFHLFNDDDSDDQHLFSCNVCGKRNENRGLLMNHRKLKHPKTIKTCSYFLKGICEFTDEVCWFSHKLHTNSTPQTLKEFKCSICGRAFKSKSEFMKQRKTDHPNTISSCRDFKNNGYCRF